MLTLMVYQTIIMLQDLEYPNCVNLMDVVTVSLESNVYTVRESDSFVEVCVILTPAASQNSVVSINTTEVSATGRSNQLFLINNYVEMWKLLACIVGT